VFSSKAANFGVLLAGLAALATFVVLGLMGQLHGLTWLGQHHNVRPTLDHAARMGWSYWHWYQAQSWSWETTAGVILYVVGRLAWTAVVAIATENAEHRLTIDEILARRVAREAASARTAGLVAQAREARRWAGQQACR
jgi:hypothetical protein